MSGREASNVVPALVLEMSLLLPRLKRHAMALTRNEDEADDLVHDCLLRAMENHARWQPGTCLRAWMFVIMRNIYFNKIRHLKYVRKAEPELALRAGSASFQPQESWIELGELQRAVNKLPPEQREVLLLAVVEELPYKQVAEHLRIPIGTVRSRLSRARLRLALEVKAAAPSLQEPPPEAGVSNPMRDGGSAMEERTDQ